LGKAISDIFVGFFIRFSKLSILWQYDIGHKSYDPNTETCAESKFEPNPIFTLIGEIPIYSFS
jgi:hypothetical protein